MKFQPPQKPHFLSSAGQVLESSIQLVGGLQNLYHACLRSGLGVHQSAQMYRIAEIYTASQALGHPVIQPATRLSKALAEHTDVDSLLDEETELPEFPTQTTWVAFPSGLDFMVHDPNTGEHVRASGCYVHSETMSGDSHAVWAPDPDFAGQRTWQVFLWAAVSDAAEDDAWAMYHIYPPRPGDGVPWKERLRRNWTTHTGVGQVAALEAETQDLESLERLANFLLGLALYMRTGSPLVEVSTPEEREESLYRGMSRKQRERPLKGKKAKQKELLDPYGHSKIYYVGRGWENTTQGQLYSQSKQVEGTEVTTTERGKTRMHWVRGHFRNQACGVGGKDRKLMYIAPHIRGVATTSAATWKVR